MPRELRIEYPGVIYHVMNRRRHREPIFCDDHDRRAGYFWKETALNNATAPVTQGPVTLPVIAQFRFNDMIRTLKQQSGK